MRWKSIIVLLAIVVSVSIPPSFPFLSDQGVSAAIGTLDVCHAAAPALSSNGDMPGLNQVVSSPVPLLQVMFTEEVPSLLPYFSVAFQDELPPKH